MPQRFTNPVIKYTTDALKTLPGALLYFYETGTTTPRVVYADVDLTTPLTNPVVADSAGNFPPIFLDGTYRAELKNSAGVTQTGWPVDDIGGEEIEGQFDFWSSVTSYQPGDIVTGSNGLRYEATNLQPNLNEDPTESPDYWTEIRFSDAYNSISVYSIDDRVLYNGDWYQSLQDQNSGNTPASGSAWWELSYEEWAWNLNITYAAGAVAYVGQDRFISQKNLNLNHNPVGDSGEWWRPYWQMIPALIANMLSGGGMLLAYRDNFLTDAGAYTLPLAASVPSGTKILISMLDANKASQPTVSRSGADVIRRAAGTDTSILMQQGQKISLTLVSNGTNEWIV